MTRVVVTGATGFIGSRLLEVLVRDGIDGGRAELVAIARHPETLVASLRARVECHALDLTDAPIEKIAAACGQGAIIFHLAANASVAGGDAAARGNVRATERLLEALRTCAPRRIVYASSIGAVDRVPGDRCEMPLDENAVPNPLTAYGASKLAGERLLAASGLPFSIVRPTWVYGPRMRADSHLRVFLEMVRAGKLSARFNFSGRVSVIHVDDLCAAMLLCAVHHAASGETYFVTDNVPVSLGTLFRELGEISGRPSGSIGIPRVLTSVARALRRWLPLAVQCLNSDVLLATSARLSALGFTPGVPRRRGLIELARSTSPGGGGRWIVTGAASGIGRELATMLHAAGHTVIAIDRDAPGLVSLQQQCPSTATTVADLSTESGRELVARAIKDGPLAGIVNCAGIGARGDVKEIPESTQTRVLSVNVEALADASARAVRVLASQESGGTIVNVASSAALQPLPVMAAYAASKAFVLSYSEALAEEMAHTAVRVITVCPGGTDTGFQAASGVKRLEDERLMPASAVAASILQAIQRGRSATLFVGGRTHAMALMARVLPRLRLARMWGMMMRKMR